MGGVKVASNAQVLEPYAQVFCRQGTKRGQMRSKRGSLRALWGQKRALPGVFGVVLVTPLRILCYLDSTGQN